MTRKNLIQIWKNKGLIFEGIKNFLFKKEDVEEVAAARLEICKGCECYDTTGEGCMVGGTQPCCNILKGGCGCSLDIKVRSLSSDCPKNKWHAVMSESEEQELKNQLGI